MKILNAHQASLINAISLILIGGYGYLQSDTPSPTALIPVGFGVLLIAMSPGVKNENKIIAHIAVLLTLITLFGLIMPLIGSIKRGDMQATFRVSIMILTTVLAIIYFIQSFIDARKARESV